MSELETTYRIWFSDGSEVVFAASEIESMAQRFTFNAQDLLARGETDLLDEGEVVGGVVTI